MLGHPPFRGSSDSAITGNFRLLNYMALSLFNITILTATQFASGLYESPSLTGSGHPFKFFQPQLAKSDLQLKKKILWHSHLRFKLYMFNVLILSTVESSLHLFLALLLVPLLVPLSLPLPALIPALFPSLYFQSTSYDVTSAHSLPLLTPPVCPSPRSLGNVHPAQTVPSHLKK